MVPHLVQRTLCSSPCAPRERGGWGRWNFILSFILTTCTSCSSPCAAHLVQLTLCSSALCSFVKGCSPLGSAWLASTRLGGFSSRGLDPLGSARLGSFPSKNGIKMKNLFCLHGRKVWGPAVLFSHEGSDRSATDVGPSQKVAPLLSESPIFAPSRSIPSGQIALLERRPPNLTIPLAGVHFWHPKWKGGVEFWNQKNCIPSSEQKNVRALEPICFSFARRYGSFNVPSLEPKKKNSITTLAEIRGPKMGWSRRRPEFNIPV